MKKILALMLPVFCYGQAQAQNCENCDELFTEQTTVVQVTNYNSYNEILPVKPTYLDGVYGGAGWNSNWFIGVQGGMSAFLGKPVGHGDFFDRTMPMIGITAGKWVSPTVGIRLAFQGFKLKDAMMEKQSYRNYHADLMYNLSYLLQSNYKEMPRWNFIPYVGLGVIHHKDNDNKPFAISYGVQVGYRVSDRLTVNGEIGNTMTWRDFDGWGESSKIGDNLLQASVGLSYTIGKAGWTRVKDPEPYIQKADYLDGRLHQCGEENNALKRKLACDKEIIDQLKNILEIEGLLEKYNFTLDCDGKVRRMPRNNYSGLNALRARMRAKSMKQSADTINSEFMPAYWNPNDSTNVSADDYMLLVKDGKLFVGSPIFFFFKLGTTKITEKAQIVNIKEIASAMKKYSLRARIIGAADSMTGSKEINDKLGISRARYIATLLRQHGVNEEDVTTEGRGGIDDYVPLTANRNACVMLYSKQ